MTARYCKYKGDQKERSFSPLEAEDSNDDLDVQDLDDVNADSNLGEEADHDFGDEASDKTENDAEKGANEVTDLNEERADLGLDRDDDDGEDGSASTEDEL